MDRIRKNLHDLNNLLNELSVPLGFLKLSLKDEPLHLLTTEELRNKNQELLETLGQLEEKVIITSKALSKIAMELERVR